VADRRECSVYGYHLLVLIEACQVDNRIRFGLRNAIELNIISPGSTIIAVQGWKGGLGHTNTLRILTVPTDATELEMQPLGSV
jgi:pyruvate kinase